MLSNAGPKRPWKAAGALLTLAVAAGCGSQYRPVVTPISPTGPAPSPTSLVAVVSTTGTNSPGIATILDFSGDSIQALATIGNGPTALTTDTSGSIGYTINSDSTLSSFPFSSGLQTKNVQQSTLLANTVPVNLYVSPTVSYLADSNGGAIDEMAGSPIGLRQAIPVGVGPVNIAGNSGSPRVYGIVQGVAPGTCNTPSSVTTTGTVSAIETQTNTLSATLPVGICPVFGIASPDHNRTFILNRGSGTVSVIDSQKNTFQQTLKVGAGPVYAEYMPVQNQLVTANFDGNSISVIDVGLDVYGNNGPNFGHTVTIPVGKHPTGVTVLQDATKAYVANQADGTVSIVNMSSFTVVKTVNVTGHPRTIYSVTNSLASKVYVVSPDTSLITVLRTDTDIVSAEIPIQGTVVDLRPQTTTAGSGNNPIVVSRAPGSGQPLNTP